MTKRNLWYLHAISFRMVCVISSLDLYKTPWYVVNSCLESLGQESQGYFWLRRWGLQIHALCGFNCGWITDRLETFRGMEGLSRTFNCIFKLLQWAAGSSESALWLYLSASQKVNSWYVTISAPFLHPQRLFCYYSYSGSSYGDLFLWTIYYNEIIKR